MTLDDPLARTLAIDDPALFLQRYSPPVLIDELRYAPQLLPHIKMLVDNERSAGRFWLTGSQQFHLMEGVSESLAGRVGITRLLGFSMRELRDDAFAPPFVPVSEWLEARRQAPGIGLRELYELIWRGSFPALYEDKVFDRDLYYSSYIQTYILRDIRTLAHVGDERSFLRFTRACAARTGRLLNMQDLCRDSDINQATGKRWLSILEASGLVYLLPPFHSNVTKRLVKTPKLYFLDTGLAAYLTEWSTAATLEAGAMAGALFETWVLSELLKGYWHNGKRAPFFFYRDRDTREVDLVLHRDGMLYPIEIKKTASPTKDSIRHFAALKALNVPIGPGCVISLVPTCQPLTENVSAVPVAMV